MTNEELQAWAQDKVFESPEQMSRLIFKEVLPNIDGKTGPFTFGPNQDTGAYEITLNGSTVKIPAAYSTV